MPLDFLFLQEAAVRPSGPCVAVSCPCARASECVGSGGAALSALHYKPSLPSTPVCLRQVDSASNEYDV